MIVLAIDTALGAAAACLYDTASAAILAEDSGTIGTDKEAGDLLFGAAHKKKDTEPSGIKSGGYRVEIKW